ncbi:MAG: carboxymuconolactone decarboxylase family protein [Ignavibacteriae bacterium]|nr:MAG: carboxymuconolactone decarboxylase family protein [Ignavibacteriota bacterium]
MNRKEVYADIEQTFGQVPTFFKMIPDRSIELEWQLFKTTQLAESPIPNKYRELIGLGIAAATKCRYCAFYHTEVAKMFGATNEEIEDAVHFAKSNAGWSAYLNGLQFDFEQFKQELLDGIEYAKKHQMQETNA